MTTVNPSNINYHNNNNNTQQSLSRINSASQQLSSHQFHNQASSQAFNESRPQINNNNLYGSYPATNEASQTRPAIYANPPPKPRRYQYYDVAPDGQLILTQQQPMPSTSATTTKPHTITTMAPITSNNPPHQLMPYNQQVAFYNRQQMLQLAQRQQFNQQHQSSLVVNPNQRHIMSSSSSSSYLSVPSLHQTNADAMMKPTQRPQTIRAYVDPMRQQQQPHYLFGQPQALVKSKSSLDAGDLARLRQNR